MQAASATFFEGAQAQDNPETFPLRFRSVAPPLEGEHPKAF